MNILRGCGRSLRGKFVGWPGFEPGTSGLKVPCGNSLPLQKSGTLSLSQSPKLLPNSSYFGDDLRGRAA